MAVDNALDLTRFRDKLLKGMSYEPGGATLAQVADAVEKGDAQLWTHRDGLVITQIKVFGEGRALNYWLAAGDMADVLALTYTIEQWARDEMGCTTAFMTGRRGWTRILPEYGWDVQPTVNFRKEL